MIKWRLRDKGVIFPRPTASLFCFLAVMKRATIVPLLLLLKEMEEEEEEEASFLVSFRVARFAFSRGSER